MRKTLGVSLLVLLLTGSASAGIMQNDAPAPPPPPADGIIHGDAPESLTQTILDLLAALPSLL
jgi:hypothetical protein